MSITNLKRLYGGIDPTKRIVLIDDQIFEALTPSEWVESSQPTSYYLVPYRNKSAELIDELFGHDGEKNDPPK